MKRYIRASREPEFKGNWSEEDIELWKSIDWKSRGYLPYVVEDDIYLGVIQLYGIGDTAIRRAARFNKIIRPNPIFPPYYAPTEQSENDLQREFSDYQIVGPMYDGRDYHGYNVHNRYDTEELYDVLTRD